MDGEWAFLGPAPSKFRLIRVQSLVPNVSTSCLKRWSSVRVHLLLLPDELFLLRCAAFIFVTADDMARFGGSDRRTAAGTCRCAPGIEAVASMGGLPKVESEEEEEEAEEEPDSVVVVGRGREG